MDGHQVLGPPFLLWQKQTQGLSKDAPNDVLVHSGSLGIAHAMASRNAIFLGIVNRHVEFLDLSIRPCTPGAGEAADGGTS